MSRPIRLLSSPAEVAAIIGRFGGRKTLTGSSYATVRDFCESVDELSQVAALDGDLKNVQRPWAAKTVLGNVAPPARLLEIGGGEPIISGFLSELGYDVTLVDPYGGFGNGPTDYQRYVERYPHVKIVRDYFQPGLPGLRPQSFDAIFSVSVLEHIPADSLAGCFDAVAEFLVPGGLSIHCFDFILQGNGDAHDFQHAQRILAEQKRIGHIDEDPPFEVLLRRVRADVETFFLSPQGHHHWRGGQPYSQFPFRRVVSLQTVALRQ